MSSKPESRNKQPRWCHEERNIDDLVDFPLQRALFPDEPPEDDERLAEDIRLNGLKLPPEILGENDAGFPENTIIDGHRRRDAYRHLKRAKIPVRVRLDLAHADRPTIEQAYLDATLNRRHIASKLLRANIAMRLHEIEKKRNPDDRRGNEQAEARERVGRAIGMTGRNAARYIAILKTPPIIQHAFEHGKISLPVAERLSRLAPEDQERLAMEIEAALTMGGKPLKVKRRLQKIIETHLPKPANPHKRMLCAWDNLLYGMRTAVADFRDRITHIMFFVREEDRHLFKEFCDVWQQIVAYSDATHNVQ